MRYRIPGIFLLGLGMALMTSVTSAETSPYAGATDRDIKALSAQQVENLLAGKGMGFALAAELNEYPGPKHVLEMADALELSVAQRDASQRLFDAMQQQASGIGAELIEAERMLDRLFAERMAEPEALKEHLDRIARLQSELRFVHLETHIRQRELLDDDQIEHYRHLRGYAGHHSHGSH